MNLWKDRRVDSLHRVVLPREAFSLLGWTSDEVLEAEALPAQDALLLRAQNHPRPQCCACGGAQDLVSLGGRRWLCGGPALPPRTPQTKPDLLNPPQQKAPRLIGGMFFYCVVSLYCIAFSAKVLFTITSCGAVFSSSPAAVITVCSKSKLSCVSTGSVLYAPMSL